MTDEERRDLDRMAKIKQLIMEMSPQFRFEVREIFRELAGEIPLRKMMVYKLGEVAGTVMKRFRDHEPAPGAWDEPRNIVMEVTREMAREVNGGGYDDTTNGRIH